MGDSYETKLQTLKELNSCYEALLDLRCIFPSWSEFKDNFFFHWKLVMEYRENGTLPFYLETLEPIISSQGNLPTELALLLVSKLDNHRQQRQDNFICENLQRLLEKDAKITTKDNQNIQNLQLPNLDRLPNMTSKDIKRKRLDYTGKIDSRDHDEASSFPSRKGVYYDKGRMLWRAYWKQDGRVITKGFSLAEFKTHEEARRNAIICREMKERELGIAI
ncbi:transcription factor with AP2 domain(s) (ApiAP2) [Babesia microti strain RI]|uniref:Transcription factor with AP2 domain(S) (ApiAP2) n=1 Tax=Babesia microti (strain RI) TaxID=1133968 RepID=A0A1R4ABS6_BABMR|nr:transcription factor with AP2 domain(s) (ApiAP2) [Babesia microti strain RI]SJK86469.1 transcription factor with AP2 domain(s) (ApiAP2) [Babesia microti strain RI]|eukprot:XP_021338626.1 transcription factor with AP2 domain(s) (ApiAP2) [Babesia microti strain RI]